MVLDGSTRDADEIRCSAPTLFARGTSPPSACGRLREDGWNVPVTIGGVLVRPGDLVLAEVEDLVVAERRLARRLRDGELAGDVVGSDYEHGLEH